MYVENVTHEITPNTHRIRFGLGQARVLTRFILNTSQLDNVDVGLG